MSANRPFPRWIQAVLGLMLVFVISPPSVPVRADIAPPEQSPGANPGPETETTQVRMVDEVVTIDVLAEEPARAHVTANFTMRNLGSQAESMDVRFPLGVESDFYHVKEIQNFGVRVHDKPVAYRRVMQETEIYGQVIQAPWAVFSVVFPVDENVLIKVSYDLLRTAWEYDNYVSFSYVLETGAGWKGTIGSATIILRLPYEAGELNILHLHASPAMRGVGDREAVWTFTDLEPTTADNFRVEIVKPAIWKQVHIEKANLSTNPRDGEAWGRLGRAYKRSFTYPKPYCRDDGVSEELYALSKKAYEKAVSLKPEDALWHAGFAELLAFSGQWDCPDIPSDRLRALQEIHTALQLAPNDPKVQEFADRISWLIPEGMVEVEKGYDFPWLTQTPLPPTETTVPISPGPASATPESAPTTPTVLPSTPAGANPPKAASPVCGAALLIPLLMAALCMQRKC